MLDYSPAPPPADEALRLEALQSFDILDTLPEQIFDDIVVLASQICSTPIALISLIDADRQWFKAKTGVDATQTHRDLAFCGHAILTPDKPFIVGDTEQDRRFAKNPLVIQAPFIRFYAGSPIVTQEGQALGTVCVIDTVPRELTAQQREALNGLSRQVSALIQSRLLAKELDRQAEKLKLALIAKDVALAEKDAALAETKLMAQEIDHRVMNSLQLISSMLSLQSKKNVGTAAGVEIGRASANVNAIARVHRNINLANGLEEMDAMDYLKRLCDDLSGAIGHSCKLTSLGSPVKASTDQLISIGLLVNELVTNAAKQGATDVVVELGSLNNQFRSLSVADNGPGLPSDFNPNATRGLGMQVILALTRKLGGSLSFSKAVADTGTKITISLERVRPTE